MSIENKTHKATLAGGCFWCTEAVIARLEGVLSVTPGYIGGDLKNPTYRDICSGATGHAEAIEIVYDPTKISFEELLEVHLKTHDPTTLNRQGGDTGTQYRSAIFFHDRDQERAARAVIEAFEKEGVYRDPIVTEVSPASVFYPAETYHQDYYDNNPDTGYCQMVITPKVNKLRSLFPQRLRQPTTDRL